MPLNVTSAGASFPAATTLAVPKMTMAVVKIVDFIADLPREVYDLRAIGLGIRTSVRWKDG